MVYEREDPLAARTSLVVVADAVQAQLFRRKGKQGELSLIRQMDHPEGRAHEKELASDVPGDTFDSHGFGRHSIQADYSVKAHELASFAREVAVAVEELRNSGAYHELALIAPPKLLGSIRDHLSAPARQMLSKEIAKRMTNEGTDKIAAILRT